MIVAPSADLELAVRAIVFAAAGTCGQRCTTLRRLIVHESIADELRDRVLRGVRAAADRRSDARRRAGRSAHRRGGVRSDGSGARRGARARRQGARRRPRDRGRAGRRLLRAAGDRRDRARCADRSAGNVRADSVRHALPRIRRSDPHSQRRAARPVVGDFHAATCARPSGSPRRPAPIAASST